MVAAVVCGLMTSVAAAQRNAAPVWIPASCDERVIFKEPLSGSPSVVRSVEDDRARAPVPRTAEQWNALVEWCFEDTRFGQVSERIAREAVAVSRKATDGRGVQLDRAESNLAQILVGQGKFPEASSLLRAMAGRSRSPFASRALIRIAEIDMAEGREGDAVRRYDEAVRVLRDRFGAVHPLFLTARAGLADIYRKLGRIDEADLIYRESLSIWLGRSYPRDRVYAQIMRGRTRILIAREQYREAIALIEPVLRANPEPREPSYAERLLRKELMFAQIDLAIALHALRQRERASQVLTEAIEWLDSASVGFELSELLPGIALNARLLVDQRKLDEAKDVIATAMTAMAEHRGARPRTALELDLSLLSQEIAVIEGRAAEGDRGMAALLAESNRMRGGGHPRSVDIARTLVMLRLRVTRARLAVIPARQLLDAARDRARGGEPSSARLVRDSRDLGLFVRAAWAAAPGVMPARR